MRPTVVYLLALAVIFTVVTLLVRREVTDPLPAGRHGPAVVPRALHPRHRADAGDERVVARGHGLCDDRRAARRCRGPRRRTCASSYVETVGARSTCSLAWALVHQLGYWYRAGVARAHGRAVLRGRRSRRQRGAHRRCCGWYPTSLVGHPHREVLQHAADDRPRHALVRAVRRLRAARALAAYAPSPRPRAFAATTRAALFAMTSTLTSGTCSSSSAGSRCCTRSTSTCPCAWRARQHRAGGPQLLGLARAVDDRFPRWCCTRWSAALAGRVPAAAVVRRRDRRRPSDSAWRAGIGATMVGAGLLAVAGAGFSGFPVATHTAYGIPVSAAGAMVAHRRRPRPACASPRLPAPRSVPADWMTTCSPSSPPTSTGSAPPPAAAGSTGSPPPSAESSACRRSGPRTTSSPRCSPRRGLGHLHVAHTEAEAKGRAGVAVLTTAAAAGPHRRRPDELPARAAGSRSRSTPTPGSSRSRASTCTPATPTTSAAVGEVPLPRRDGARMRARRPPPTARRCSPATSTSRTASWTSRTGRATAEGRLPARTSALFDRLFAEPAGSTSAARRRRRPGPVHLVVVARPGVRHRRRLAHRLPPRHAGLAARAVKAEVDQAAAVRRALERPRPAHRHLRLIGCQLLRRNPGCVHDAGVTQRGGSLRGRSGFAACVGAVTCLAAMIL